MMLSGVTRLASELTQLLETVTQENRDPTPEELEAARARSARHEQSFTDKLAAFRNRHQSEES